MSNKGKVGDCLQLKTSKITIRLFYVFIALLLWASAVSSVKSLEAAQLYLKFDQTSTKSEIRVTVVISSSQPVGAFWAEYGYDQSYLKLKSISSDNGGKVYSRDQDGTVSVIYLNANPSGENYLTLKFSIVQEGSSDVTAYYKQVLTSGNTELEYKNNNDCHLSVGAESITASSSEASKTSSSSSGGKVTVEKDDNGKNSSSSGSSGKDNGSDKNVNDSVSGDESQTDVSGSEQEEFFSFDSENPVLWAFVGAGAAFAVMLIIFTSYRMGVKKAKSEQKQRDNEEPEEQHSSSPD